jgi:xanthine dehydrogenase accessory factor
MTEFASILQTLRFTDGEAAALATLVSVEGSSYRRPGARALLCPGHRVGSISGGCLEEDVRLRGERVLHSGRAELATYDTTQENDVIWGLNTGCRGVVQVMIERIPAVRPRWVCALENRLEQGCPTDLAIVYDGAPATVLGTYLGTEVPAYQGRVFRERIEPPPSLTIFGAGDDAIPLARMTKLLGWRVTVVDPRRAYANRERFPEVDATVVTPAGSMDEHVEFDSSSYAVVMTHRFTEDLGLLRILLSRRLHYLGLLGPRSRTDRLLTQLRQEGAALDPLAIQRLCAPIGLDLGGTSPEAIALSILAEMQCHQSGRTAVPLRDRAGSIHG